MEKRFGYTRYTITHRFATDHLETRFTRSLWLPSALLFLLLCIGLPAQAQISSPFQYRQYQEIDGLPNELIKSIAQDTNNFIWAGTDNGIVRFNGIEFTSIQEGLPSPYLKHILSRPDGSLLATTDMGMVEIISESDTIFPRLLLGGSSQPTDSLLWYPKLMYEDSKGQVWLSDNHAIWKYEQGEFRRYPMPKKAIPNHFHRSFSFFEDGYGHLFAISERGYLFQLSSDKTSFVEIEQSPKPLNSAYALQIDDGKVYISTASGLLEYTFSPDGLLVSQENIMPTLTDISCIVKTEDHNTLIAGRWSNPAVLIDIANKSYQKLEGFPSANSSYILNSTSGIWSGGDNGLTLIKPNLFKGLYNDVSGGYIQHWAEGANNRYFYSDGQAVYQVWEENRKWQSSVITQATKKGEALLQVLPTPNGVWVSNSLGEISCFRSHDLVYTTRSSKGGSIFMMEQDNEGNIWFCQDGLEGVGKITKNGKLQILGKEQGLTNKVSAIKGLPTGELYFIGKGDSHYLFQYHKDKGRFENKSLPISFKKSGDLEVFDLVPSEDGGLWLASNFGLLYLKDQYIERLPIGNMTKTTIKALAKDQYNNLWMANSSGIVQYRVKEKDHFIFDEKDGLGSKIIGYRNLFIDTQNRIWAGSIAGLYYADYISPKQTSTPKVIKLSVNNKPFHLSNEERSIYPDDFITLQFVSSSYPSQFTQYEYRLDSERSWRALGRQTSITLGQLTPGEHQIHIRAKQRANSLWSKTATHKLTVSSYWYSSPIIWFLGIIIIGLMVWSIIAANTKRLQYEKNKLEAIIHDRTKDLIERNHEIDEQREELQKNQEELETSIENLRLAQSQLVQAEKMSSIGQLTAGIAHEINNPINFVYAGSNALKQLLGDFGHIMRKYEALELAVANQDKAHKEVALRELMELKEELVYEELQEDILSLVADIRMGAERSTEIVKNLRNFSRMDDGHFEMSDIEAGIDSTLTLLTNKLKRGIEVRKEYIGLPQVYCMPAQINQVFMNIISNAIDATEPPGTITISTHNYSNEIKIIIKDTGMGIPDEIKRKIFDPFFTTKPVGEGTGLGMSVVYSIIEKHQGRIEIDSTEGEGTAFIIHIPKDQELEATTTQRQNK